MHKENVYTDYGRSKNHIGVGMGPKNLRDAEAPSHQDGGMADPRNIPLPRVTIPN